MIMNFVFFGFLMLSAVLVALLVKGLIGIRRIPTLPADFGELPPKQAARVAIGLVERGLFLRHILRNSGSPRDNKKHIAEYTSFLDDVAINAIKKLKGCGV
jgi:hypothetical protein